MATAYRDNQDLRQFIGMNVLAFLPVSEVADGMKFLRANAPVGDAFDDWVNYFMQLTSVVPAESSDDPPPVTASSPSTSERLLHCSLRPFGTCTKRRCPDRRAQTTSVSPGIMASLVWLVTAIRRCGCCCAPCRRMRVQQARQYSKRLVVSRRSNV